MQHLESSSAHQCGSDSEANYDDFQCENEEDFEEWYSISIVEKRPLADETDLSWEDDDSYDYESESELGGAPFEASRHYLCPTFVVFTGLPSFPLQTWMTTHRTRTFRPAM